MINPIACGIYSHFGLVIEFCQCILLDFRLLPIVVWGGSWVGDLDMAELVIPFLGTEAAGIAFGTL